MKAHPNADLRPASAKGDDEEGDGLDAGKLAAYARFVLGAVARRRLRVALTFLPLAAMVGLVYWMLPRSYYVETQLFATRNPAALSRDGSTDSPTRGLLEMVFKRDNLVALVKRTRLVAEWAQTRSRAGRFKDRIDRALGRQELSDEAKAESLVWMLEGRLSVRTAVDYWGEGTVTFGTEWPEPRLAYHLTEAARDSFLEARSQADTASIVDALSLLTTRAGNLRQEIDKTARAIQERVAQKGDGEREGEREGGRRAQDPERPRSRHRASEPATPEGVTLAEREAIDQAREAWIAKKARIKELDEGRGRRIAELQARLGDLRTTYADSHPLVVDTLRTVETLKADSPQLADLRREESELRTQYLLRATKAPEASGQSGEVPHPILRSNLLRDRSIRAAITPSQTDDRETQFAKQQLRFQTETYDKLLERIDGARMELETVRTGFKYRYMIVRPAELPRAPVKPKPAKIVGGGLALAVALAVLSAVVADLRSGRVYQGWQIERALGIPVLADMRHEP